MSMERLYVYNFDVYVGQLINNNGVYSFIIENDKDSFCKKAIEENNLRMNCNKSDVLYEILVCDRVCPPNRVNIREILDRHGMEVYDPWILLNKTFGRNVNDLIWMHPEKVDPDWFYTNHPDGLFMSRYKKNKYKNRPDRYKF